MSAERAEQQAPVGVPDFVVCGHAVQDLLSGAPETTWRLGGAVSYAALLAQRFGLRAGVLTSAGPEMPFQKLLPGIDVANVNSERSTQMRNVYESGRRRQQMPQRASRIGAEHLPEDWRRAPIVLLGPVAGELDDSLGSCFKGALVGAGAQGWLRATGADTNVVPVSPERWKDEQVLRHTRALFVSDEDVPAERADEALQRWRGMVETVAFTRGYDGADVCHQGEWRHINAFSVEALDPTGAGDIFAAAFLIRLHETGDPWEATRVASCAASFVVEGEGVAAIPDRQMVESRLRQHPEVVAR